MTSSVGGLKAYPHTGHYMAAKHGVVGLMRTFAVELGAHNIRVNSVHPTNVNTPMFMNEGTKKLFRPDLENPTTEDMKPVAQFMHVLPIGWVEPEDISQRGGVPGLRRSPLHHRRHAADRRRQLPQVGRFTRVGGIARCPRPAGIVCRGWTPSRTKVPSSPAAPAASGSPPRESSRHGGHRWCSATSTKRRSPMRWSDCAPRDSRHMAWSAMCGTSIR